MTFKTVSYSLLAIIGAVLIGISFSAPSVIADEKADTRADRVFVVFDKPVGKSERALVRAFGGDIVYSYSLINAVAAHVPEEAQEGLARNPHVLSIQPDGMVQALDTELDNAWGVERIGAGDVHETYANTGSGVKVGIIDSGINYDHPELDDIYQGGYDFYYYDHEPMDVYGHGTHVAATACGENNGNGSVDPKYGVVGVAPTCDLYSLRVLNEDGVGYWSDIAAAVEWATGAEVHLEAWGDTPATTTQGTKLDVVNLSLGKDAHPGSAVENIFQEAYDKGLLIVAAAGNSGNKGGKNESTIYPAKFSSVIAVAATDDTNTRATFSSTGEDVELAAPGVDVYSAWNNDTAYYGSSVCNGATTSYTTQEGIETSIGDCYKYGSGTSMASPHVAGTAALVIAAGVADHNGDGVSDNKDVRMVLQNTATDLGAAGRDGQYGYGLVNARLAVETAGTDTNAAPVADAGADQAVEDTDEDGSEEVTLDGSGSEDADGSVVSYDWWNNDTLIATGTTPTVSLDVGEYTITLIVTDDEDVTGSDSVQITVQEPSSDDDGGDGEKCPPGWQKQGRC